MKGVKKRYYGENLSFENIKHGANAPLGKCSIFHILYDISKPSKSVTRDHFII